LFLDEIRGFGANLRHPLQSSQDDFLQRIIVVRSDKAFFEDYTRRYGFNPQFFYHRPY
jgi:hypothetical protein